MAFTIRATLWLEDRKRGRQREDERRLLLEALQTFRAHLPTIEADLDPQISLQTRVALTAGYYEIVLSYQKLLEYARQDFKIQNFNTWSALNAIEHDFSLASEKLRHEERIVRGRNVTEAVLEISRRELVKFARDIAAPVNAALKALGEEDMH